MTNEFVHVAAYRFVELTALDELRTAIFRTGSDAGVTGLVLLAPEGINLCLGGTPSSVRSLLQWLVQDARFVGLDAAHETKWSHAETMPYGKLRVKLKGEIIRMNRPQVRPVAKRAPSVAAERLEAWLTQGHDDTGREIVLLDTRNAFELEHGAFANALDMKLKHFSDFPEVVQEYLPSFAGKTVVAYCTGGIRCEKAVLHLESLGVKDAVQLEGGILRYFETVGAAHYQGKCFVFDRRIELSPNDILAQRTQSETRSE